MKVKFCVVILLSNCFVCSYAKPADSHQSLRLKSKETAQMCQLPPKGGICRAYIPRYYYDSQTRSCKKFVYGGCMGNENSFDTTEECMATCKHVKT